MTTRLIYQKLALTQRAELLEVYRPESLRLALRITGNPAAAEDIVQTAFLRLIQSENLPILIPEILKYTRRTVTNCAIDFLPPLEPSYSSDQLSPSPAKAAR